MTVLAFLAGLTLGYALAHHRTTRQLEAYKAKSRRVLAECRRQFLGDEQ